MNKLHIAIHQNIVTFFKTPASLILAILPVSMLFIFGSIYPVTNVLPHIITISIICVSFTFVGIQFIEYRQNKFFRTNKSISMPNSVFLLGTFVVLVLILIVSSFTLIVITWFFTNAIPVLQQTIDNMNFDEISSIKHIIEGTPIFSTFNISNINWLMFTYGLLVSVTMTSLLAIFVGGLFKSVKSYTVLTLTYLILFISLGGLAIPWNAIQESQTLSFLSALIPNTHTNNLMISAMNYGHVENAKSYIAFSNEMCIWINDIYNNLYLTGLLDVPALQGIINIINYADHPAIEEWMSDPLESGIVPSVWPWLEGWMQTLGDFFGNLNIPTRSEFVVYFGLIARAISNSQSGGLASINVPALLNSYYSFYHGISSTLTFLLQPNAFDLSTQYGLVTNIFPLLIILLSLPNFILIGGEE